MSDTPRTDMAVLDSYYSRNIDGGLVVHPDFARELERELNQAKLDLDRIRDILHRRYWL